MALLKLEEAVDGRRHEEAAARGCSVVASLRAAGVLKSRRREASILKEG
jgi:hypothetical protein